MPPKRDLAASISAPGRVFIDVTPSDTVDLVDGPTRWVYIGGTGNLEINDADGNTVLLTALTIGVMHPIQAVRILAGNTSATLIKAVY